MSGRTFCNEQRRTQKHNPDIRIRNKPMMTVGLVKTTLIDFPHIVASTVFTPGCNFRCPYCHNPELVSPPYPNDLISTEELEAFLEKRHNVIEGVCITGGEPLIHDEIITLVELIRRFSLKIKIDTNGSFPERLKSLSPDYIAMDVKTSLERYGELGFSGDTDCIIESIEWIKHAGIHHEFRTTVTPELVTAEDIRHILPLLKGAELYVINPFRPGKTLDPEYEGKPPYSPEVLKGMASLAVNYGIPTKLRTM